MKSLNEAIWRVTQSSLTRNGMNRTKTFRVEGKTKKDAWKAGRHKHLMKHGLSHLPTLHLHSIEKISEEEKKPYKNLEHTINEIVLGMFTKAAFSARNIIPRVRDKIKHGAYLSNRKHTNKKDDFKFSHPNTPQVLEEGRNQKSALSRNRHSIGQKRQKLNRGVRSSFKPKTNRKTGAIIFKEDINLIVNKYVNEAPVDVRLKPKTISINTRQHIIMNDGTYRHPIRVSGDVDKQNPQFPSHIDRHTARQLKHYGYNLEINEVVRSDQRTEVPVTKYDPKDKRMEITKRNRRRKEIKLGPERQGSAYGYEPYVNPATGEVGPSN